MARVAPGEITQIGKGIGEDQIWFLASNHPIVPKTLRVTLMAGMWIREIRENYVTLSWKEDGKTTPVAITLCGTDQAESLMRATPEEIQAGLKGLGTATIQTYEGRLRAAWEIHRARYQLRNRIDDREVPTVRGLARQLVERGDLNLEEVAKAAGLPLYHLLQIVADEKPMTMRLMWILPLMSKLGEMARERAEGIDSDEEYSNLSLRQ